MSERRIATWIGIGVLTAVVACTAVHMRGEGNGIIVDAGMVRFDKLPRGYRATADRLLVQAMSKPGPCDVSIERIVDSNGDGIVGNAGDEVTLLNHVPKGFQKFELKSLSVDLPEGVKQAYIRVRGRPDCPNPPPTGPAPLLQLFSWTSGGISPMGQGQGVGFMMAGSTDKPHFCGFYRRDPKHVLLRVGDLPATRLDELAAMQPDGRQPQRPLKPDFLGALVMADGMAFVIPGPDKAEVLLPHRPTRIRNLRILIFDKLLLPGGDWQLKDLGF